MLDTDELRKLIGNRLMEVGKAKGLKTRPQRADYLDITPRCLANWENGQRLPAIDALWYVSEKYGVPLPYLIGWQDQINIETEKELILGNDKKIVIKISQ